jgi:hypothetical protein
MGLATPIYSQLRLSSQSLVMDSPFLPLMATGQGIQQMDENWHLSFVLRS